MTILTLKSYQRAALYALRVLAQTEPLKGAALAFATAVELPYLRGLFGALLCVCLRIPTGGGETLAVNLRGCPGPAAQPGQPLA